jgi:hypothetical protein
VKKQFEITIIAAVAMGTSFAGSSAFSETLNNKFRQNAPLQRNMVFRNNNVKSDALNPQPLPPGPPPSINRSRLQQSGAFRNNNLKSDALNPQPLPPGPPPSSFRTNMSR